MPGSENLSLWEAFPSGTFISLRDVDLRGYGAESVAALGARLANQFLLADDETGPQVELFVHTPENAEEAPVFKRVEKIIAFKNIGLCRNDVRAQLPDPG